MNPGPTFPSSRLRAFKGHKALFPWYCCISGGVDCSDVDCGGVDCGGIDCDGVDCGDVDCGDVVIFPARMKIGHKGRDEYSTSFCILDSVPKSSDFHYLFHLIMTFLKISFISTLTSSSSLTLSAKSFQIFIESPLYLEAFNFFNEIIRYAPLFRQEILTLKPFTMPGMA